MSHETLGGCNEKQTDIVKNKLEQYLTIAITKKNYFQVDFLAVNNTTVGFQKMLSF